LYHRCSPSACRWQLIEACLIDKQLIASKPRDDQDTSKQHPRQRHRSCSPPANILLYRPSSQGAPARIHPPLPPYPWQAASAEQHGWPCTRHECHLHPGWAKRRLLSACASRADRPRASKVNRPVA
jgi:hypothetical protein